MKNLNKSGLLLKLQSQTLPECTLNIIRHLELYIHWKKLMRKHVFGLVQAKKTYKFIKKYSSEQKILSNQISTFAC